MANIKQQIKRIKTNEKRRQANVSFMSSLKTAMKSVKVAVTEKNKDLAVERLNFAYKKLDKALAKHVVHRNFVNRNKSGLANLVNTL